MKTRILILTLFTTLFVSCSTTKKTTSTIRSMDINGPGVIQIPVVVDLEVINTKVNGSYTMSTQDAQVDYLKSKAIAIALQSTKADVLIEPTYEIIEGNGIITVTVTGFPGTYKNFRTISKDDIPLLQIGSTKVATVTEETILKKKRQE